ncbi:response regulator [Roseiflexus sp. RS-1]|jgi:DNA-binding response OmpR family regulator|uniref:response regulator n=1 Tax=Roseiflexus sp. (strain RS-1) TaxID=357808 RepID=UPI0000D811AD|nr:response regulator [Roseiflexus sp. RS-1]ABQ90726.1 response regulator receiver protein [Roseiflexus sp. RS-1]MBO9320979.1 response regulator [Roseiflexus sp.]
MNTPSDTILVVDDTPANLAILFTGLRNAGYKVLINERGDIALQTAAYALPDLIILDVMMPGIDGFETCRRLKEDPRTRDIPVILMTALTDPIDEVTGLRAGAVDYITKPIHVEVVLARISTHLTLRKLYRDLERKHAALKEALATIKTLSGIIPICAWCGNKIRDERGEWMSVATYLETHAEVTFSHTICPDCYERITGEAP